MQNQKKTSGASKKEGKVDLAYWDQFDEGPLNMLSLTPALKRFLDDNNLTAKFINASTLSKSHGFDHRGWKPFEVTQEIYDIISKSSPGFSKGPDNYIYRGDCVLAVMPKQLAEKRRQVIAQRNKAYSEVNKIKAQELREMSGGRVKISEGYED